VASGFSRKAACGRAKLSKFTGSHSLPAKAGSHPICS